jgi:predicted outer membrane repeat protein
MNGFVSLRRFTGADRSTQAPNSYRRKLGFELLEDRRVLAAVVVNTALDTVNFNDGLTSLREAIFAANIVPGADTIEFDPSLAGKTILLTQGQLTITDGLTISGLGADKLTIDASGSDPTPDTKNGDGTRVFNVERSVAGDFDVAIRGLTLTGGDANGSGGAVLSDGNLEVSECVIENNFARGSGGGIYAQTYGDQSRIEIRDCVVSGNSTAATWTQGGGIALDAEYSKAQLTVEDCQVFNNTVTGHEDGFPGGWAHGGGIYVAGGGPMRIAGNQIYQNSASGTWAWGGGLFVSESYSFPGASNAVDIQGNSAYQNSCSAVWTWGGGVGIQVSNSVVNIRDNTIDQNNLAGSVEDGGGLSIETNYPASSVTIDQNRIRSNRAVEGGGIYVNFDGMDPSLVTITGSEVDNNEATSGGGIYIGGYRYGSAVIQSSTIAGNTASDGGGIYTTQQLRIDDSTVSGNRATNRGGGIIGFASVVLSRSTVTGNTSRTGGGFYGRTAQIDGSILAGNGNANGPQDLSVVDSLWSAPLPSNPNDDFGIDLQIRNSLLGTNREVEPLFVEPPVGSPDANGNLIGGIVHGAIDPLLFALTYNGGLTMTQAPKAESPAIDAGDPAAEAGNDGVPQFDQRAEPYARVVNGRIDMGAVEQQLQPPALPGDFNRDNVVDSMDYLLWQRSVGSHVASYSAADGNGDGVVGPEDREIWRAHFGNRVAAHSDDHQDASSDALPAQSAIVQDSSDVGAEPQPGAVTQSASKSEPAPSDGTFAENLDPTMVWNAGEGATSAGAPAGPTLGNSANVGVVATPERNLDGTAVPLSAVDPIDIVALSTAGTAAVPSSSQAGSGKTLPSAPPIVIPVAGRNRPLTVNFEEVAQALSAAFVSGQGGSVGSVLVREPTTPPATTGDYGLNDPIIDIVMTGFGDSSHTGGLFKRPPRVRSGANR